MPPPTTATCRGEPGTNTAPCWDEDMPAPSPATGAPGRGRPGSRRHRMRGDAGRTQGSDRWNAREVDGWGWAARVHAAGGVDRSAGLLAGDAGGGERPELQPLG